ncbi:hypothetical protein BH10ACI2_BH10ACI2_05650 [soil metagenome]
MWRKFIFSDNPPIFPLTVTFEYVKLLSIGHFLQKTNQLGFVVSVKVSKNINAFVTAHALCATRK